MDNYQTWILIFLISYVAATISGVAGFGGGIILLPIISSLVGIKYAVPILTVAQIFGNFSRVYFGFKEIDWKPVMYYMCGSIPASILGALFFVDVDAHLLGKVVGLVLIIIVIVRRLGYEPENLSNQWLILGGIISGFLSSVTGIGGPVAAMLLLNYGLVGTCFVATEATTAVINHLIKIVIYSKYQLITWNGLAHGCFLGIAMIAGSWTGKKIIERISKKTFILFVELLLLVTGIWFLFH
ncbi:MAG: sulfite exporter TauE/SafE family protein [Cytophagales bacterium]|nr:sulfite exporter TauE/SafE family protein [Cytophagales bacterium]